LPKLCEIFAESMIIWLGRISWTFVYLERILNALWFQTISYDLLVFCKKNNYLWCPKNLKNIHIGIPTSLLETQFLYKFDYIESNQIFKSNSSFIYRIRANKGRSWIVAASKNLPKIGAFYSILCSRMLWKFMKFGKNIPVCKTEKMFFE